MGVRLRRGRSAGSCSSACDCVEQLVDSALARARDGLVGADHESLDARLRRAAASAPRPSASSSSSGWRRSRCASPEPADSPRLTTSGTSSFIRQREELSTTIAPASAKRGAHSPEIEPPAENSAMSKPSIASALNARTTKPPSSSRPTDRSEANGTISRRRESTLAQQLAASACRPARWPRRLRLDTRSLMLRSG